MSWGGNLTTGRRVGGCHVFGFPLTVRKWSYAMTQNNPDFDKATQAAALIPSELLDVAKKKIEALLEVQKELMQTLEGINHELFNRAKKEAELASEFVGKLASARSVPDATTTYHEWASKEMELLAADGRQMFAHGEKIMQASRRLFSNGMQSSAT
jgi:Phasin protein